jgi:murein DD-endopeptidase MepM/ murein hydrolase activator NlpD
LGFVLFATLHLHLTTLANAVATALHRHPRRIAAVVGTMLLGSGSVAFGVASLGPDAADMPVREVSEAVQPLEMITQIAALDTHHFKLYRQDTTRSTDTADTLLKRLGVQDSAAAAFLRSDGLARLHLLRAGKNISLEANDKNELLSLTARWAHDDTHFTRLVIDKDPVGFKSRLETAPLVPSTRLASGTIRSSLFAATDEARVPDVVTKQLTDIFSADIDFHRALRKGDRFSLVYETLTADGEPIKTGRLLSAEFVNGGRTSQAMWFQEPGSKGQYFGFDGKSLKRAFLASPLEFSRMTSGFGMRSHPIAGDWRQHKGVDYAAPTGTPIMTVGDGVVEFAGTQRGYGNVIEVKHRDGKSTLFAHLSKISVQKGQRVEQGQVIGAVGSTGWSTGPHLHFEFRINGEHHDPLTLAKQAESAVISAAGKALYERQAAQLKAQLVAAAGVVQTRAQ